jgi:hypothetical protein
VRDIVSSITDRWLIVLGLAYVCTVLFFPDGFLGTIHKWGNSKSQTMKITPMAAVKRPLEAQSNADTLLPTNPGD